MGNAMKYGQQYDRLKTYDKAKAAGSMPLIPLDAFWGPAEVIWITLLVILSLCLIVGSVIVYDDHGISSTLIYTILGFGIPTALVLFALFNTDSRYFLDVKNKRIIFRFSFFIKLYESVLMSFANILSIELDANEVGKTAAGSWQYYIVAVKKDFTRVAISNTSYSSEGLPEIGKLIAKVIGCPYKEGKTFEKLRIMGM